jgi:hypothetical protein
MAVFWVVAPCSLVDFTSVSEVLAASVIRAFMTFLMPGIRASETSVNLYQTERCYNPEDDRIKISFSPGGSSFKHILNNLYTNWAFQTRNRTSKLD